MTDIIIYTALVLFGVTFGSFIAATVWRIRANQLQGDKDSKLDYDKSEYSKLKKLLGKKGSKDRSLCLHCNRQLKWYELIPVVSWFAQGGRCRSCKKPIGKFEILSELGLAAFFVLSYLLWPQDFNTALAVTHFILWLAAGVVMLLLFAYDMKWFLLPDLAMFILIAIGLVIAAVVSVQADDPIGAIYSTLGSVLALAGLYGAIYFGSKGRWVGLGDVILGIGLGLILADWRLALVALFMANLIGCLIVVPLMIAGKLKRNAQVPFGPLLIAGTIVSWFAGESIIAWYMSSMGF